MFPKVLKTIFLALGLAMVWLGFFYHHELKKGAAIVQEAGEEAFSEELEFYTLADEQYAEDGNALSSLDVTNLNITDSDIATSMPEPTKSQDNRNSKEPSSLPEEKAEAPVTEKEFSQVQEAAAGDFPLFLALVGGFFIFCGLISVKVSDLENN